MNNLQGQRVLLRDLCLDDVTDRYVEWMNNPQVNRYMESRFQIHTVETLSLQLNMFHDRGDHLFAIIEKSTGIHIGNLKIGEVNRYHQTADIGLMIGDPTCWGKGYASEAIQLGTNHAYQSGLISRLICGSYVSNIGSISAFIKSGYKIEGTKIGHVLFEGRREDCVIMGRNNF